MSEAHTERNPGTEGAMMLTEGTTRSCFSTDDVPALAEF